MPTTTKPPHIWLIISISGWLSLSACWSLFGWISKVGPFVYQGQHSDFFVFSFFLLIFRTLGYGLCAIFLYGNKPWVRWLFLAHALSSMLVLVLGTWIYNAHLLMALVVRPFEGILIASTDTVFRGYVIHLFVAAVFAAGVFHHFPGRAKSS